MSYQKERMAQARDGAEQRAIDKQKRAEIEKERKTHAGELADVLMAYDCACMVTPVGEVVVFDPEKLLEKLKEVGL